MLDIIYLLEVLTVVWG